MGRKRTNGQVGNCCRTLKISAIQEIPTKDNFPPWPNERICIKTIRIVNKRTSWRLMLDTSWSYQIYARMFAIIKWSEVLAIQEKVFFTK